MYFKSKHKGKKLPKMKMEKAEDNPPAYEGKEHVKYKNPGFSRENIRNPEDQPHMKSRVSKEEMHQMEDNFHMDVPDQTEDTLPKKIKRAFMKMDQPDEEGPKPLHGNLVTMTSSKGVKDEDGWENYGPEEMQEDDTPSVNKTHRKKIAVAMIRRKMKKKS